MPSFSVGMSIRTASNSTSPWSAPLVLASTDPRKYPGAYGKVNSFTNPLGSSPGKAFILLAYSDVARLGDKTQELWLTMFDGVTTLTIKGLRWCKSQNVSGGEATDSNCVHMVELRDIRHFLGMSDFSKQYNVRWPAHGVDSFGIEQQYYPATMLLTGGTAFVAHTWEQMCENIWDEFKSTASTVQGPRLLGSWPGFPNGFTPPDKPPEDFRFIGMSAWDALASILDRLGLAIQFRPATGDCSIVNASGTQAGMDAAIATLGQYLDSGGCSINNGAYVPQFVTVHFHRRAKFYGTERFTALSESGGAFRWDQYPDYAISKTTGITGAIPFGNIAIWDDLPAIMPFFSDSGTADNDTDLQARATERKNQWVNEFTGSYFFRRAFSGLATLSTGSQVKAISWGDWGRGPVTHIVRYPGLMKVDDAGQCEPVAAAQLQAPDIARKSFPNYPPMLGLVQINSADDAGGDSIVEADANGFFDAELIGWDPSQNGATDDPVTAFDGGLWLATMTRLHQPSGTDGVASPNPILRKGMRLMAKLNGTAIGVDSSDIRPMYVCQLPKVSFDAMAASNWHRGRDAFTNDNGKSTVTVRLPSTTVIEVQLPGGPRDATQKPWGHPNIIEGNIIRVEQQEDGKFICISAYLDSHVGAIRFIALATAAGVPQGWAICDGSGNSVANGGSGLDLVTDNPFVRLGSTQGTGGVVGALNHHHDITETNLSNVAVTGAATALATATSPTADTDATPNFKTMVPIERLDNSV